MDFLKAQFAKIQEQLSGLSATQKMLVVSLLTIMVMTLMWWSHWAAEPEMSPLLDQAMSTEEVGQISSNLEAQGIPHQVVGNKVMVPADRRLEIMSVLGFSQALPKNFDEGFDAMIKQMNILDSPDKTDQMFLRAKEQTLSELISGFAGVTNAFVVIDPTTKRDIGGNDVQPVATVTITTNHGGSVPARQLAQSAALAVSGAQAGLQPSRVNVIIDGMSIPVKDPSDDGGFSGDDTVDTQKRYEDYYKQKIEQALQDIRGVMVQVTVKLDTSKTTTTIHKVDPKQTVSVPMKSEETSDESNAQQAGAQEPGAVPNTANQGDDLGSAGGGGGGTNTNSTTDKNEFMPDYGHQDQVVSQAPGSATVASASVRIPRSYFVQAYKNENGGKDPDDSTVLTDYMTKQTTSIHDIVKGCAVFPSDDAIIVNTYSDEAPAVLPMGAAAAASPVTGLLTKNAKEIGVGALAVVSLFMVSMMVRKGATPAPVAAQALSEVDPQTLNGNETIVGSAAEKSAALDGMELDEETVKAEQTLEQVQQMVQSNPDAAASLVKRWLNR